MQAFGLLPSDLPVPGPRWGTYPERREGDRARAVRGWGALGRLDRRMRRVRDLATGLAALADEGFDEQRLAVQCRMARSGLTPRAIETALAVACEAGRRSLGRQAYDSQLMAAWHLLDQRLVEMATGEGKSLATALAACAAALSGVPVHVLTSNDYLVRRDADAFAPLYRRVGLEVAAVVAGMSDEERRRAYACSIVYVTARELVFDYLRDRQRRPEVGDLMHRARSIVRSHAQAPVLRGLCMALVDEADSVLIDEARMPLILSREVDLATERAFLWQAWRLSGQLSAGRDFTLEPARCLARLTAEGEGRLAALAEPLGSVWRSTRHRAHAVVTALAARHLLLRDRDYVVSDRTDRNERSGRHIVIVDQLSGRAAQGRRWARGLHAMVAIKEACRPEPEMETLAQMTYQRFFRRFHRVGGVSGTLREVRSELRNVYGLAVVAVAPRLPCRRHILPMRVFESHAERWDAVVQRCIDLIGEGRAVLVATDSVCDSRALSMVLHAARVPHAVLDARQDADEAEIVALAGRAGQVTVATQMAGRGTDIAPDAGVLRSGGLHVLCCQANASRRLDRQLAGRAARQGQPGTCETWVSLESSVFSRDRAGRLAAAWLRWAAARRLPPGWFALGVAALQRLEECRCARARLSIFRTDCRVERELAFAVGD